MAVASMYPILESITTIYSSIEEEGFHRVRNFFEGVEYRIPNKIRIIMQSLLTGLIGLREMSNNLSWWSEYSLHFVNFDLHTKTYFAHPAALILTQRILLYLFCL